MIDNVEQFIQTLPKSDASALRKALVDGALQANCRTECGYALLHHAIASNKIEAVRVLLLYGADPDALVCESRRPLHMAFGRPEIMALLLEHGADVFSEVPEERDPTAVAMGPTALHWAARAGPLESCRLLIERGLGPSYRIANPSDSYLTPMQAAVAAGSRENARYFVFGCGEDPWQLTGDGRRLEQLAPSGYSVRHWLDEFRLTFNTERSAIEAVGLGVVEGGGVPRSSSRFDHSL